MRLAAFPVLLVMAAPLAAKSETPDEPASHPEFIGAARLGAQLIVRPFFDPGSAQFRWTSGFHWGYTKPLIGKKVWGWLACGMVNAKNRLGGYVGEAPFVVVAREGGQIEAGMGPFAILSSCYYDSPAPVSAELASVGNAVPVVAVVNSVSVADEIRKLSELKAGGVLTEAEYAAQKEKLLAK